jgi:hypothetical protein
LAEVVVSTAVHLGDRKISLLTLMKMKITNNGKVQYENQINRSIRYESVDLHALWLRNPVSTRRWSHVRWV